MRSEQSPVRRLHPPQTPFGAADADRLFALAERPDRLGRQVAHAVQVLRDALDRYGLDAIALSFNGGKDCTVLLHIWAAVLLRHYKAADVNGASASQPKRRLRALYVRCRSPFPQVEEFIDECAEVYGLDLVPITAGMREALERYREVVPSVRAVLVGTRRGDPHGSALDVFAPTDGDWPDFMRVHPILDWSYADIWDFLRCPDLGTSALGAGIAFCGLYQYGYTSLGSTHDTFPNPTLRSLDEASTWHPAWMLADESLERAGREGGAANGTPAQSSPAAKPVEQSRA